MKKALFLVVLTSGIVFSCNKESSHATNSGNTGAEIENPRVKGNSPGANSPGAKQQAAFPPASPLKYGRGSDSIAAGRMSAGAIVNSGDYTHSGQLTGNFRHDFLRNDALASNSATDKSSLSSAGKPAGIGKANAAKKKPENIPLKVSPAFGFGVQWPTIQANLANDNSQSLVFNYVPGLFGKLNISKNLDVGIEIFPFMQNRFRNYSYFSHTNPPNNDSTGFPPGRTTTNYQFTQINVFAGAVSLDYRISGKFSLQGTYGVQFVINAKVNLTDSNFIGNNFQNCNTNTYFLNHHDHSFTNINLIVPYAGLMLWYRPGRLSIGLGYKQNLTGWFVNTPDNSAGGQLHLALRYQIR